MDIGYLYTKLRKNFGKQCVFCDDGPKVLEDTKPDDELMRKYIIKNPVSRGIQAGCVKSENEANTHVVEYVDHGMNHVEGGWPKEVDTNDEEAVVRFRKKVERLNTYVSVMKHLLRPMEHAILQNNAVNIYEKYFLGTESTITNDRSTCRIQATFRDPNDVKRPITHCSWSPYGNEFCVSHCNPNYQRINPDQSFESIVWDVENPNTPLIIFRASVPIVALEYNPKDPHVLAGGMYNGQVAHYDSRKGREPICMNIPEKSHRDPVHSVLWVNSKSGMEFFTASSDGTVLWWDSRKLEEPIDMIILDMSRGETPSLSKSFLASCLEYEPSIPVKYMVGTENGYVISGNRKGTNQTEKLPWMMKCHFGPIYSVHRNQVFTKNFLTVGGWTARVWSEDCKESSIFWTKFHNMRLTGGEWSTTRYSVFFLTREDGVLDLWDILQDQNQGTISFKLTDQPLTSLRVRDDGELVVAANSMGSAYVVRYSPNLAETSKNDKIFLSAMFDREGRREKLLETRNREIKVRLRDMAMTRDNKEDVHKMELQALMESHKERLEREYLSGISGGGISGTGISGTGISGPLTNWRTSISEEEQKDEYY